MEKENLQQKIMEMDETIELLEGSNQVRADTTLRMVNTPHPPIPTLTNPSASAVPSSETQI
jgi:hypothetical protein